MELTDFEYKLPGKEKKFRVKKLKAPFVLLYINDPECDDCSLTTLRLSVSQSLLKEVREGRLVILSVYPDGETDEWLGSGFYGKWRPLFRFEDYACFVFGG